MDLKQKNRQKRGFTLAEALVMILITSLIIVATMPVITRKSRHKQDYKFGPPGGYHCVVPCEFAPPAKAKNFAFYFNNSLIPSFSARNIGTIKLVSPGLPKGHYIETGSHYVPPTVSTDEGLGIHNTSWDEYKKDHTIQEDDITSTNAGGWVVDREWVVDDPGGCKGLPSFWTSLEDYTKGKVSISGSYCTDAKVVRIVY